MTKNERFVQTCVEFLLNLLIDVDVHCCSRSVWYQTLILYIPSKQATVCIRNQSTVCFRVTFIVCHGISVLETGCRVPAVWNEEVIYNVGQMRSLQTVYKNIHQLPPAHLLVATENGTINVSKYYETSYITRREENEDKRTEEEMIDGVRERLLEAIRLRMRADVKVGVYLSGGLDSSTLLGMATTMTNKPIDTYSIAFKDDAYFDEQSLCHDTNKFLGTNKTTPHVLEVTHDQLAQHFDDCIYNYEYPLMHISGVAKYMLSKMVRDNHGKVVLTGEGSDEIFSG